MRNYLLYVFVLLLGCTINAQLSTFLEAFPDANLAALNELSGPEVADIINPKKDVSEAGYVSACAALPAPAATTNIRALKPGHIKVVMAMGDSITAGMSAKDTSILNLKEYRGISFSIGGDSGVNTFPNILKQFAPNVIGFSTGVGQRTSAGTGLNGAVSGALNKDMPSQAEWLVSAMKTNTKIDFKNDWKILTIWIGSNNLCAVCNNNTSNNGDDFQKNIMNALEYLYTNVPRLFVNLLPNLDVSKIYDIKDGTCGSLHNIECSCITQLASRTLIQTTVADYWKRIDTIAANFEARKNDQFVVVSQPFLKNSQIYNRTFLSAADCFHPSAISHSAAATALWNSIISRKDDKKTAWNPNEAVICPTESTLLYTN